MARGTRNPQDVTGRKQDALQREHAEAQREREVELAMVTAARQAEVSNEIIDLTKRPTMPGAGEDPEYQHSSVLDGEGLDDWRHEQSRHLPLGATKQPGQAGVSVANDGYLTDSGQVGLRIKTNATSSGALAVPVINTVTPDNTAGTLANSTLYSYKLTALNARGESLPSAAVTATTGVGDTENVLAWTAVSGATGYKVYGRKAGKETLLATLGAVTTYTDTGGATPGTATPPLVDISGFGIGAESPFPVVGGTIADQLKRPTVDTRNATNVGGTSGPDSPAPLVYQLVEEPEYSTESLTRVIRMDVDVDQVTYGAGNHVDLKEGRRYNLPAGMAQGLIEKGYAR